MSLIPVRLKQLREDQNTSQEDIAAVAGVSQVTWSTWEREPPKQFAALFRLAKKFEISANYLLGLNDDPVLLLNTVARQAKISDVHPHRFRHTFAITFLRNGGNTFALQKLLGHSELSTVLKYVKLAETDIKAAQAAASVVDNWRL